MTTIDERNRAATKPAPAALPSGSRSRRRRTAASADLQPAGKKWAVVAWLMTLISFAPVAWMVLTSLHREADAAANPPALFAPLTFDQYQLLLERGALPFLLNSAMASGFSTVLVIALAVPAAYALSIRPVEKWTDVMFFFLSTKMLPVIAGLLPIYLIVQRLDLLDNIWTLVLLYTAMNLPIAIWMLRSFLAELPTEVLEAAAVDGAGLFRTLWSVIRPMAMPGIAATALICTIFSWNEFLFAVNLTATQASTAPVFLVGFITNEGLFLARLCAAATLVSLPVILAGFAAQDKLVRGISLGAVK